MNRLKKIIAYAMVFVSILNFSTIGFNAKAVDGNTDTTTIGAIKFNSEYQKYASSKAYDKATEAIEVGIENCVTNAVLTDDGKAYKLTKGSTVEFLVSIPKNASYNIELSFAPADTVAENA